MSKKYSIVCINEGKPFDMPKWSVDKHEKLLECMIALEEKLKLKIIEQKDYDKQYRLKMILLSIHEIDPNVTEKDLQELHPDDFIDLWMAVYNSGKRGVVVNEQDFPKGESTPQK
jgi:hypothetical protein